MPSRCFAMDVTILLSKAHAEFRKLRSGELGDNLRAQGIEYKTIWGLESYRLKGIASYLIETYQPTAEEQKALAEALWKEDVRESKMLATRLYPITEATEPMAQAWATEVKYTEIADQLCMNMLSRLPFASALATQWIDGSEMKQYMALQLALRLELKALYPQAQGIAEDSTKPLWLRAVAARCKNELEVSELI